MLNIFAMLTGWGLNFIATAISWLILGLVFSTAFVLENAPLTTQGVVTILAAAAMVSFFVTIRNILKNWALWDERA